MKRFAAFENDALKARLVRLQRAEADLDERIRQCVEHAQAQGRWVRSDPLYQRLVGVVSRVRNEIRDTEAELARRSGAVAPDRGSRAVAGTARPHVAWAQDRAEQQT